MSPNLIVVRTPTAAPHGNVTRGRKQAGILYLFLAFCLFGAPSTRAEVLVYQFRTAGKVMGNGVDYRYSTRGYIVWDLGDNRLSWVAYGVSDGNRVFRLNQGSPIVASFTGQSGKRQVTFSGADSDSGRYFQDFNQGRAALLKHATGQTVQFPRTFKGQSHSFSTGPTSRLDDNSHTMVYSPARTLAANDAGKTSGEVVSDLIAELEADGYTEAPPSPPAATTQSSSVMLTFGGGPARIISTNAPPAGTE